MKFCLMFLPSEPKFWRRPCLAPQILGFRKPHDSVLKLGRASIVKIKDFALVFKNGGINIPLRPTHRLPTRVADVQSTGGGHVPFPIVKSLLLTICAPRFLEIYHQCSSNFYSHQPPLLVPVGQAKGRNQGQLLG